MFKLKYNFLAVVQISIGVANYALLMKSFGVSASADVYLMGIAVVASLQLLQMMFVEQFMYFYSDLKLKSASSANAFFNFSFTFSLLIGVASFLFSNLFSAWIIKIFAYGIDPYRLAELEWVLRILFFSLLFYPAVYVNVKFLNAEMRFSVPYVLNSLPNLAVVIMQVVMLFYGGGNILFLCYAYATGVFLAALAGWASAWRMGVKIKFSLAHESARDFIRNSVSMRFGHNIHNFLFTPVTNNFLALLPPGYASYFYYAQKLVSVVFSVTIGPAHNVFLSKVANCWSSRSYEEIVALMRRFLKISLAGFISAAVAVYLAFPLVMRWLPFTHVSAYDVLRIKHLFLLLAAWNLVIVVEMPFVGVGMAAKKSSIFIISNTIFILAYFLLCLYGNAYLGVYAIPVAAIAAQIVNFLIYSRYASSLLGVTPCSVLAGKKA